MPSRESCIAEFAKYLMVLAEQQGRGGYIEAPKSGPGARREGPGPSVAGSVVEGT